jgi:methyl-accepting chemotaxis protein
MKNLKIGTRLLTGFLFMVVLIIGISIFSYLELRTIEGQADQMAAVNAKAFALLAGEGKDVPAELKNQAEASHGKALAAYRSAVASLAAGCTLAALAAIVLAVLISRSIIAPLRLMTGIMRDIAEGEGDLTKNIYLDSKDELGELSKWFDMFMDNIQEDITQIGKSTHQIAAAAEQLHATAAQIAADAAEVSEQAEKVATAGEEMSASSGDIARSCGMAVESSRLAGDAAVSGARVVNETIAVMNSIAGRVKETAGTVENLGGRSEQIGAIAGTIQEIADQTNLLALNAAIEAARAGEQGRGFAVVADEVRKLAERTRKATAEISEMIRSIQSETKEAVAAMETGVDEVTRGSAKAAESGNALARILEQINHVTEQINQVARAAEEQTAVTTEISNNMHQITEVVARSSSGARETTKAADGLSEQARELDGIVGQFKV